jgi:hypothetical protein
MGKEEYLCVCVPECSARTPPPSTLISPHLYENDLVVTIHGMNVTRYRYYG